MNLFREIDYDATADKTEYFFTKQLDRLLFRTGHSMASLKSPVMSDMPKGNSCGNNQETKLIESIEVDKVIKAVHEAIFHCNEIGKTILIMLFIDGKSKDYVINHIPYEQAQFYRLKTKALVDFADLYEHYQGTYDVADENQLDLHVYKNDNFKITS